ncbi:MAG: hypothetical protein ABSE95_13915 [Thermodesulfobacteriota bacterium]
MANLKGTARLTPLIGLQAMLATIAFVHSTIERSLSDGGNLPELGRSVFAPDKLRSAT